MEIISKILPEHQALGAALPPLRDGWTPRAPLGSSLSVRNEIQIPDRYMPQANVSEAEPQKQAMWNSWWSHESRAARVLGCFIWRKFCCGNPQQESPKSHLVVLSNYDLAEILRRKSTAIISACLTALREMLSSSGDSAAEIHGKNFPPWDSDQYKIHREIQINTQYSALATNMLDLVKHPRREMTG